MRSSSSEVDSEGERESSRLDSYPTFKAQDVAKQDKAGAEKKPIKESLSHRSQITGQV